jgi:hypothetical protein
MRVLLPAAEQPAGLHQLMARLVNRGLIMVKRAHQGVAVGAPSHQREVLANLNAGYIGRDGTERPAHLRGSLGLQIPGVQLAGAADQQQHDTIPVVRSGPRCGLEVVQFGQRQSDRARRQRADAQEVAPREAITRFHAFFALELQHGSIPCKAA